MKILVVADEESKALWNYYTPDKIEGVEMILACGDLKAEYLEFLVTMANVPLYYVTGNHDKKYVTNPPEGCICIDDKIVEYNGVRILGLGGSMKYKDGPFMYTERQMKNRIRRIKMSILKHRGFDIMITHAAAKGYGDMTDLPHIGFDCFNNLLYKCKPSYMLHGHVHSSYKSGNFARVIEHPSGATIINCYERYILDYPENSQVKMNRRELIYNLRTIFDLNAVYKNKSDKDTTANETKETNS